MQFIEEIILKDLDLGVFELKTYETIDSTNDECKRISSAKDVHIFSRRYSLTFIISRINSFVSF